MPIQRIKRNRAKCLNCQQTLDVTGMPSDRVLVCNCHGTHLSGGNMYVSTAGSMIAYAKTLTEWEDVELPQEPLANPEE